MSNLTWYEYYPDANNPNYYSNQTKLNSTVGSYYVYNVLFSGITGQCIRIEDNDNNYRTENMLLVEFVTFSQLTGTDEGLAIYVVNGGCIQLHVCDINPDNNFKSNYAHSFYSYSYYTSARTVLTSWDSGPSNFLNDSSISSAISDWGTILQDQGDNRMINVNNSHSTCNYNAFVQAIYLERMNYCSIINNTANKGRILYVSSYIIDMSRCNFINNEDKHEDNENGIFFMECSYFNQPITSLAFIGNKAQYLFYMKFDNPQIYDCYLDKNDISSTCYDCYGIGTTNMLSSNISILSSCFWTIYKDIDEDSEHSINRSKSYGDFYIMNTILSVPIFIVLNRF